MVLYLSYCMGFKYGLEEAQSVKQESQSHILNAAHEVHPRADASILPSPSRPGMPLGTGSDASGRSTLTFKCIRCLEPATLQNSCTTGSKTMSSREHQQCMSILKSHRARMKLNPMLAQWWKQASADHSRSAVVEHGWKDGAPTKQKTRPSAHHHRQVSVSSCVQ